MVSLPFRLSGTSLSPSRALFLSVQRLSSPRGFGQSAWSLGKYPKPIALWSQRVLLLSYTWSSNFGSASSSIRNEKPKTWDTLWRKQGGKTQWPFVFVAPLSQWFLNLNSRAESPGGLVKLQKVWPPFQLLGLGRFGWSLRICISSRFPDDSYYFSLRTLLWKQLL